MRLFNTKNLSLGASSVGNGVSCCSVKGTEFTAGEACSVVSNPSSCASVSLTGACGVNAAAGPVGAAIPDAPSTVLFRSRLTSLTD